MQNQEIKLANAIDYKKQIFYKKRQIVLQCKAASVIAKCGDLCGKKRAGVLGTK